MTLLLLTFYLAGWFALLAATIGLFALRRGRPVPPLPAPLPRVSILVAARNEEAAIARCLRSLRALHYPAHLLEVLLGDDASTDATAAVAAQAMQGFGGTFRVLPIAATLGQARGKANVLAHLAQAATTDFFFITDADIAVPPTWVEGLLAHARPGIGTVTGLTLVTGPRLFHRLQGLDWLLALSMVQVVSDAGQPVTAMGNNMLVTRAAYQATGGYETLPFSVTEDYELFRATLRQGFGYRNLFRPEVLAESLPQPTLARLLSQRRRWARGAGQLPGWLRALLLYHAGFYPVLLALGWVAGPAAAAGALLLRLLLQGLQAALCFRRVGRRAPLALLPAFDVYSLLVTGGLALYQLLPGELEWKGRRYR